MNNKDRVTLMLCTNASGNKAPIMMIGKSEKPRSLEGLKHRVKYYANQNGWMTGVLATRWFKEIFVPFKRNLLGDVEKAVLLWDNHSSHTLDADMLKLYPDIHVLFLPPNLTSHHQPLDAGIIAATKLKYKTVMVQMLDDLVEHWEERRKRGEHNKAGTKGLLQGHHAHLGDAVFIIQQAWDVITDETIKNCWVKAKCLPANLEVELMKTSEKGRAKLAERAAAASSGATAMATDDDGWEVMDSGQLDFSHLQVALDKLAIDVEKNRAQLVGGNDAVFPVLHDAVYSAESVGVEGAADKTAAAKRIVCLEEDDEVVEALGQLLIEEVEENESRLPEAPMDLDGAAAGAAAAAAQSSPSESDFERLRALPATAEAWMRDLARAAGCVDEVAVVLEASKKYFDSKKANQKSIHAFFKP